MKKNLILLMLASSFALANGNTKQEGCSKTDISIFETIFSCPSGDYLVSYTNADKKRLNGEYAKSVIKLDDTKAKNK